MPFSIPNTTTQNTNQTFSGVDRFASGFFVIANASAIVTLIHGIHGNEHDDPEAFLPPGTYPLAGTESDFITGIRVRSAVTGVPAQIFGIFYYPNEASIVSGTEFNTRVNPNGSIISSGVTGQIIMYGGNAPPAGFADADGSSQGRTDPTFANLFAVIGVAFGSADGTHFNLPDMRGRMPVGLCTTAGGNADVSTLALSDPSSLANRRPKHRHTIALGFSDPSHNHSHNDPGHIHSITATSAGGANTTGNLGESDHGDVQSNNTNSATTGVTNNAATTGITFSPTVGASTNDNLDAPPYLVLRFCIQL